MTSSTESLEETLRQAVEEARWKAGPVRIEPWIGLKNAAYVDNVFTSSEEAEEDDFTITLGAGLRFYLPFGDDTVLSMHALPEYVYWQNLGSRRRLNGRYGAGLFGFYNRLTTQLTATTSEQQSVVTPEFQQYVNNGEDQVEAQFDLQMVRSLYVFLLGRHTEYRNLLDEQGAEQDPRVPALQALDRQEQTVRAGFRLELGDSVSFGIGVDDVNIDFGEALDRSNQGTSPFVSFDYSGPVFGAQVEVVDRELEPDGPTSIFVPFSTTTGTARVGLSEERRIGLDVYARREMVYALSSEWSWFVDESLGASLRIGLGRRSSLSFFGEVGDHDYEPLDSATGRTRLDDVTSIGFQLSFKISESVSISLNGSESEYDSNLPLEDRTVSYIGFSLQLGNLGWP